jgi:hypothetical protein
VQARPSFYVAASHPHVPIAIPSSGPISARRTLAAIEGTLSKLASETALAAESLRDNRHGPATVPDRDVAIWCFDRLVRAALATRDTCRAARAAIDDRGSPRCAGGSSGAPRAASADVSSQSFPRDPQHEGRWIVVGHDGSNARSERCFARPTRLESETPSSS